MTQIFGHSYSMNIDGKLFSDLRVTFRVIQDLKPDPNEAVFEITNFNSDSRAQMVTPKPKIPVQFEAGYRDHTSLLFLGIIRRVDQERTGTDWVTRLRTGDGQDAMNSARLSLSLASSATLGDALEKMAEATGLALGNARTVAATGDFRGAIKTFTKGFSAHGNAFDELVKVANQAGYTVSCQNGELLLLAASQCMALPAVLLSSQTGLEGSPSSGEKGTIKAKSKLNAELRPGRAVKLQSAVYNGFYRVEAVTHTGDSHGKVWDSDLVLRQIPITLAVDVGEPVIDTSGSVTVEVGTPIIGG